MATNSTGCSGKVLIAAITVFLNIAANRRAIFLKLRYNNRHHQLQSATLKCCRNSLVATAASSPRVPAPGWGQSEPGRETSDVRGLMNQGEAWTSRGVRISVPEKFFSREIFVALFTWIIKILRWQRGGCIISGLLMYLFLNKSEPGVRPKTSTGFEHDRTTSSRRLYSQYSHWSLTYWSNWFLMHPYYCGQK